MEYRKIENTVILRLDPNEKVVDSILKVCQTEQITLGNISGLGAVNEIEIGLYDVEKQCFCPTTLKKSLEMANLTGNVTTQDGQVYLHLHAVFGDVHGNAVAGHLKEAVVSATCEIFISSICGTVERRFDPVTGLNILNF